LLCIHVENKIYKYIKIYKNRNKYNIRKYLYVFVPVVSWDN